MYILRDHMLYFLIYIYIVCFTLKIDCFLANSADLDEMPHYAAFHFGYSLSAEVSCLQWFNLRYVLLDTLVQE